MRNIDVPWDAPTGMDEYLQVTRLVGLDASTVRDTAARLVQGAATPREAAISIYNFCRDEIKFGYNRRDAIPASEVLRDGYGQCNTKSVLLVTLLRAAGIPARFHLAQVDKAVQWGVMPPLAYRFAPDKVTHTWVEVYLANRRVSESANRRVSESASRRMGESANGQSDQGHWIVLEGMIMDKPYFLAARQLLLESDRSMGYAIGLPPEVLAGCADGSCIDWDGVSDVTCQTTAVVADFGTVADPEGFYRQHAVSGLRGLLFERHTSREMTGRAERIRRGEKM